MTRVDLEFIGIEPSQRLNAIQWLIDNYGLPEYSSWYLTDLRWIYFKEPKHATHFVMRFS